MTYKKPDKTYYLKLFETCYDRLDLVSKVMNVPVIRLEEIAKEQSITLNPDRFQQKVDLHDLNCDIVHAYWNKQLQSLNDEEIELIYQRIRKDLPEILFLMDEQPADVMKKTDFFNNVKMSLKIKTYAEIFSKACIVQYYRDVRKSPDWDKKISDYLKGLEKDMKEFIDNGYIFSSDEPSAVFSFSKDSINYSTIKVKKIYSVIKKVLNEPDSEELLLYSINFLGKKRGYQLKEAWAFDQFLQNKI